MAHNSAYNVLFQLLLTQILSPFLYHKIYYLCSLKNLAQLASLWELNILNTNNLA